MSKKIKAIAVVILLAVVQVSFAQTANERKAYEAIELMDNGEYDKSLKLLEEARKLDPKNIVYPYEIAYANYLRGDYKTAIKTLRPLLKHPDVYDIVYQLLGNSYSMDGQRKKAIQTYEKGIKLFPNSGKLYLERGNMELLVKEYGKALSYYEKGIEADPAHPSNYYWASKIYCATTEEVWGMIYGEIFMNLERNTRRTAEISKLLFNIYKSEITFSDSSTIVSFSQNASISLSSIADMKLPYGVGVYEPTLILSMLGVEEINLSTLNEIRSNFVDNYFKKEHNKKYPNVLFDYQKQIKDAGHMEAYNYWILMMGDEEGFVAWQSANQEKWESFVEWFNSHQLQIDENSKFHSSQY